MTLIANDAQFSEDPPGQRRALGRGRRPRQRLPPTPVTRGRERRRRPSPSTVDGLVTALTHMTGFDAGPVADATIGGHAGKTFALTNSDQH